LSPSFSALLAARGRDLLAGREHLFAGLGVDQREAGLAPRHCSATNGICQPSPALPDDAPGDLSVEVVEHLLVIEAERVEQRGHRQLALAVDADVDDVLGVELEVEPRAAVRDHPRGEQELARGVGLAAVVVEQHARRTVHLADDHALGAVDDEGAVLGHERHVAHVDVLLLDIEHGAGLGLGVDLEHDQPQRDLHRRRVSDAALAALGGVVLRVLELVVDEVELGGAGEVADREHRAQRLLEARDVAGALVRAQELLVAFALDLDQVRHLHHFVDVAEDLADALLLAADGRADRGAGGLRLLRHGGSCLFALMPGFRPGWKIRALCGAAPIETPKTPQAHQVPSGPELQH
jgi:hypothetical protein